MENSNNLIITTPTQSKQLAEYHLYSEQEIGCLHSPLLPVSVESNKGFTLSFKKIAPSNTSPFLQVATKDYLSKFLRDEKNEPLALWQNLEQLTDSLFLSIQEKESNLSVNFDASQSMAGMLFLEVQEGNNLNLDISYLSSSPSSFLLFLDVKQDASVNVTTKDDVIDAKENFLYLNAKLNHSAEFNFFSYKTSRQKSLQHIQVELGDKAIANTHELVNSGDSSNMDSHIIYIHRGRETLGNQNVLQLIGEKSTAAFTGKIEVSENALNTESYQLCNSILLSDDGKACHRPQLEIENKEVKCSHGATSGKLDENALFYLQSRGFSKSQAEKLLISAKVEEFIIQSKLASSLPWLINYLKEQDLGLYE